MINKWFLSLKQFFYTNPLYCLYIAVLALICCGIFIETGIKYLPLILLFFSTFTLSYFGLNKIKDLFFILSLKSVLMKVFTRHEKLSSYLAWSFYIFVLVFIVYHFYFLGFVPAIKAYNSLDYYGISFIRQSIVEHDSMTIKYLSAFVVKGLLPFLLLFFYIKKRKWFYILLAFAVFYAMALMQKSFIVTMVFPLIIYTFLIKKYLQSFVYFSLFVVGVFSLVYIANPPLRASKEEIAHYMGTDIVVDSTEQTKPKVKVPESNAGEALQVATDGIVERVFYTTGMVATYWFDNIPSKYPHSGWCGYRITAPLAGCNYADYEYSRIIYDEVYKEYAAKGLKGTVTAASFVYDYASFGYPGVAVSGIILALFFLSIQRVFGNDYKWIICLNFLNVFWLSSASLTTLLLSGGWFIIIVLYSIFENDLKRTIN